MWRSNYSRRFITKTFAPGKPYASGLVAPKSKGTAALLLEVRCIHRVELKLEEGL